MTFTEFCETIKDGIASGELKTSTELTELDLAIQYAIGQEMQEQGGAELTTDAEQIYFLIGKHCGAEIQSRVLAG